MVGSNFVFASIGKSSVSSIKSDCSNAESSPVVVDAVDDTTPPPLLFCFRRRFCCWCCCCCAFPCTRRDSENARLFARSMCARRDQDVVEDGEVVEAIRVLAVCTTLEQAFGVVAVVGAARMVLIFDLFSIHKTFFFYEEKKGKKRRINEQEREPEKKTMTSSSSSSSSSKEAHGTKEEEENGRSKTIKALDPARSKEYVRKLIQERQSSSSSSSGSLVRVEVTDGRTFEGTLGCVDKQLNVVLINATETKRRNEMSEGDASLSTSSSERLLETRVINMALIAREHRVKMEVLVDDDDAAKEEGEDDRHGLPCITM